jgi:hypothetical protein
LIELIERKNGRLAHFARWGTASDFGGIVAIARIFRELSASVRDSMQR